MNNISDNIPDTRPEPYGTMDHPSAFPQPPPPNQNAGTSSGRVKKKAKPLKNNVSRLLHNITNDLSSWAVLCLIIFVLTISVITIVETARTPYCDAICRYTIALNECVLREELTLEQCESVALVVSTTP